MGLEVGVTRIKNLNSAWPLDTDIRQEGAAHLRNVKLAVQGSFPSLGNGQCTMTAEQLNTVVNALQSFNGRGPFFGDSSAILPEAGDYTLPLMGDVDPGLAPTNNQVLRYVTANTRWEASDAQAVGQALYTGYDSRDGAEPIFTTEDSNTLSGICTIENPATSRGWRLTADVPCEVVLTYNIFSLSRDYAVTKNDSSTALPAFADSQTLALSTTSGNYGSITVSDTLAASDTLHLKFAGTSISDCRVLVTARTID